MEIQLKSVGISLPNCWKQCGASFVNWNKLKSGEVIGVKSIPESIEHLVDVIASSKKNKKESE